MKLLIIGATGRTGQEILHQALEKGHEVTAFVRNPEKVVEKSKALTIRKGESTNEDQLADALRGQDAVVSVLGPTDPFEPSSLLQDSAVATTRAMIKAGVKRLVVLSAAAHFSGLINRIGRFFLRNHMRDSHAMEEIVEHSGLDWTIARPPRLTQQDSLSYRTREDAPPTLGFVVARKAVAAFMLNAIEQGKHLHKIVGIAR
jgi:putative NADH-flavin reductase